MIKSCDLCEKQTNKAFKSDSQRLAVSLRSSIAKRCSHLNAALCDWAKKSSISLFLALFGSRFRCRQFSIVGLNS
uniref:Uncharacterized protein n=1 Tax=Vibrio vulnificus TaxID=672 RepID=A0A6S4Q7B7_VIBVL|nr:conserved hypothetical protein [Vibrio vulnificus]